MRIVLLLLVAANLLAFAWGQGWLAPIIGDVRQPERMHRQVGPERLRVLERGEPGTKARAVAGRIESAEPREASAAPGPTLPGQAPANDRPGRAGSVGGSDQAPAGGASGTSAVEAGRPGNATGAGNDAGSGADALGLREMAARPPGGPASDASPSPAVSPEARPAPGAGAEPPRAAPAVPFGLAEPPITAALADESTPLASAAGVGTASSTGPDPAAASNARAAPPAAERATADAALPGNLETGAWPAPAPKPPVARAAQVCFDLRGLDAVRAAAAQEQLEEMGATSVEELAVENRSGYIVYVPASETVEQAQARIEQLREQGVRDIYLVLDGTYRLAISLGVFNRMDSVELLLRELRARGVEDAEVGFVNPAASRVTLRVRGPGDLLEEEQVRAVANLRGGQLSRCA